MTRSEDFEMAQEPLQTSTRAKRIGGADKLTIAIGSMILLTAICGIGFTVTKDGTLKILLCEKSSPGQRHANLVEYVEPDHQVLPVDLTTDNITVNAAKMPACKNETINNGIYITQCPNSIVLDYLGTRIILSTDEFVTFVAAACANYQLNLIFTTHFGSKQLHFLVEESKTICKLFA